MTKSYDLPIVTVSIHGGVANLVRKPAGVIAEILDFDTDGCDKQDLCREKKCRYEDDHVHTTWEPDDEFDGYKEGEQDEEVR